MNRYKNTIRGVIFDMDGTIIDTEHVWEEAIIHMLKAQNIHEFPSEKIHFFNQLAGKGIEESIEALRKTFDIKTPPKELANYIVLVACELFKKELKFIAGFESFHNKLKSAGIPSSIATNCDVESLQFLVEKMNFSTFFGKDIYCATHVGNKYKPDPALFLHAADRIGACPDRCIVFEDSLCGFQAALAAGMPCIGVRNKKNHLFCDEHTHATIQSYDEAEEAIKNIIAKHW